MTTEFVAQCEKSTFLEVLYSCPQFYHLSENQYSVQD